MFSTLGLFSQNGGNATTGALVGKGVELVVTSSTANLTQVAKTCGLAVADYIPSNETVLSVLCNSAQGLVQLAKNTTGVVGEYIPIPQTPIETITGCVEDAICGTSPAGYYVLGFLTLFVATGAAVAAGVKYCKKDSQPADVEAQAFLNDPVGTSYGTSSSL
jgi:hypothetical protein